MIESMHPWLENARESLRLSDDDYSALSRAVLCSLGSKWSLVFALLFIVPGTAVGLIIARSLPNTLFPFSGATPAFVYSVLIQFCLGMLMILGAGCWVIVFVFARAAKELSQLASVNLSEFADDDSLSFLSQTALRNCIYMLVTIATAMPGVAYVAFSFGNRQISFIVTVFGMVLPTIGIASSFFAPNYYLSEILRVAKSKRVSRIKEQIRICDNELETKVREIAKAHLTSLDESYRHLSDLSQHLHKRLQETKAESTWPFNTSSLLRLGGSALLPAVTFFLERILKSFAP